MTQEIQGAAFHIEHVESRSKGGSDGEANLALACPSCNLRKSDRSDATDPTDGSRVRLFHPRRDVWTDHFGIEDLSIVGRTPIGRATATLLDFNSERRLQIREIERILGLLSGA